MTCHSNFIHFSHLKSLKSSIGINWSSCSYGADDQIHSSVSASIKADILTFMCVNTMPQPSQEWTSQPEQGTSMACFKVYFGETLFSLKRTRGQFRSLIN